MTQNNNSRKPQGQALRNIRQLATALTYVILDNIHVHTHSVQENDMCNMIHVHECHVDRSVTCLCTCIIHGKRTQKLYRPTSQYTWTYIFQSGSKYLCPYNLHCCIVHLIATRRGHICR